MNSKIVLQGCRQHNLKNLTLQLPKNQVIVITGVSGSGKSSLAFDTLHAEGQRRYLEFLSPEAHQVIRQMPKPEIDLIEGLSPTLAISQRKKVLSHFGTVATYTDLYDFFTLLFARIGQQHSPFTGVRLTRYTRQEIIDKVLKEYPSGTRIQLLAPVKTGGEQVEELLIRLQKMGFVRIRLDGEERALDNGPLPASTQQLEVVVDRLEIKEGVRERLAPSIETAMDLSQGQLKIQEGKNGPVRYFTEIYVCPETGYAFPPLEPADFNFNSPRGACPECQGKGVISPDKSCPKCMGGRLKLESLACRILGQNIQELCEQSASSCLATIQEWEFSGQEALIAKEILPSIIKRLQFLEQVGLGYLSLDRKGSTLSDGEAKRIQLAAQIGAKLSGLIYILDEPSLGLHRKDITHLQQVIEELKQLGNTVILVEHEKSLILSADHLLELGPIAGKQGGYLTFQGTPQKMIEEQESLTGMWLSGKLKLPLPTKRKPTSWLTVENASLHNLKNLHLKLPLGCFTAFCGVSGSGKSTLVIDVIGETLHAQLNGETVSLCTLKGGQAIKRLVFHEKKAERFSSRSIPATYVGLMNPLRALFAETRLAKARGYTAPRFSLNKKGGRCEACEGLGQNRIKMALMPDLMIPCEVCQGKRYNYETLQVTWENHSIADVLNLSAQEALAVFRPIPPLANILELMNELGLDYLTLGQSFNTLSGGEIQRLRLVADLAAKTYEPTLYILDEPSTGLHLQDIEKLVKILHCLVDRGHSIFVIEHHLELLQQADWLVELGPGGGPNGGNIIFEGRLKELLKSDTPTGQVLRN